MSVSAFLRAREVLLRQPNDHPAAYREFAWPLLDRFNWALDYFDVIADGNETTALHVVADGGTSWTRTFAEMRERSNRACQMIAEHSGHDIVGDAPELVVRAVRAVTDAVRAGSGKLAC